ncbi:GAF domain-like protein [Serendipita vermifera]|nr:GAF domain-like protein [Serendipita vermifera]
MPHADSSFIPSSMKTKREFWEHVHAQLVGLLDDQSSWVTNLANASSLVYHALMAFDAFGTQEGGPVVNWCGFYLDSCLFPPSPSPPSGQIEDDSRILLLGPFCGRPACQYIRARKGGGVCADAYLSKSTLTVPDVEAYPGHIACDGDTQSEIVIPMSLNNSGGGGGGNEGALMLGVMDLDSIRLNAFDEEDVKGLERIVNTLVQGSKWYN